MFIDYFQTKTQKKIKTEYQKTETNTKNVAYTMETPKGEEKKKLAEKMFESTMIEIFQN